MLARGIIISDQTTVSFLPTQLCSDHQETRKMKIYWEKSLFNIGLKTLIVTKLTWQTDLDVPKSTKMLHIVKCCAQFSSKYELVLLLITCQDKVLSLWYNIFHDLSRYRNLLYHTTLKTICRQQQNNRHLIYTLKNVYICLVIALKWKDNLFLHVEIPEGFEGIWVLLPFGSTVSGTVLRRSMWTFFPAELSVKEWTQSRIHMLIWKLLSRLTFDLLSCTLLCGLWSKLQHNTQVCQ